MEQKLPPARPAQSARLQLADVLVALAIMAVCVAMRIATLGDTNYHDDDLFYFLVGQRMHDGDSLADVAYDTGFADQAHFTRTFKSAFGVTPGRDRALRARGTTA